MSIVSDMDNLSQQPDIEALDARRLAFIDNPLARPNGADNDTQLFLSQIEVATLREKEIVQERARRLAGQTTDVVDAANGEVDQLIAEARFGAALALLDERQNTFPQAELAPVRTRVVKALLSLANDKTFAQNNYRRFASAITAASQKDAALKQAIERLEFVVARYGEEAFESAKWCERRNSY